MVKYFMSRIMNFQEPEVSGKSLKENCFALSLSDKCDYVS